MDVIICIGPPGSGKTTWTNNYIKDHPDFLVISRDRIRELIYPIEHHRRNYWRRKDIVILECIIKSIERLGIEFFTKAGKSFILDSTNCNIEDFINGINKFGKSFEQLKKDDISVRFKIFDGHLSTFKDRVMLRDELHPDELSFIEKYYDGFIDVLNYIRTDSVLKSMIM